MIRVGVGLSLAILSICTVLILTDAYTREKTKGSGAQELVIILFILAIWLYSLYRLDEL